MTPKRGRPAGLQANPDAFTDMLAGRSQKWLSEKSGVSPSHLNEMLSGRKGAAPEAAAELAAALGCRIGTLFPQRAEFRTTVRVFTISGEGVAA